MGPFAQERPCIHIVLLPGADEQAFRDVQLGAEEEGVPCRLVEVEGASAVDLAYAAATSSRFNIGIAVSQREIVLHETHMPTMQPVMAFELADDAAVLRRLMGSNAARLVIRRPLRFADDPLPFSSEKTAGELAMNTPFAAEEEVLPPEQELDPAQIAALVALVVRKLQERGIA